MKKTFYFLSLLAATAALNACSSNDEVVASGEDGGIENTNAFLHINISLPGGTTRAAVDGGYEDADSQSDEYQVKSLKFLFFDQDKNYLTEGKVVSDATQKKDEEAEYIESNVGATVVLGPTTIKPNSEIYMLSYVNFQDDNSGTKWADMKGKTLDEVLSMTETDANRYVLSDKKYYVMTTSAYVSSTNSKTEVMRYTKVPSENFKTSATEAETNPVDVYVERTMAKIAMTVPSSVTTAGSLSEVAYNKPYKDESNNYYFLTQEKPASTNGTPKNYQYTLDGKLVNFAVKICGWKANAVNTKGYLIKNISEGAYKYIDCESGTPKAISDDANVTKDWSQEAPENTPKYYWNNASNFRSFWAEDLNYAKSATVLTGLTGDGGSSDSDNKLTYYCANDILGTTGKQSTNERGSSVYVYENTVNQSVAKFRGGDDANVTTMLVVGQIGTWSVPTTNATITNTFTAQDMYRVQGAFYTKKYIIEELLNETYCTHNESGKEVDLKESDVTLTEKAVTTGTSLEKLNNVGLTATPVDENTKIYARNSTNTDAVSSLELPSIFTTSGSPVSYYKNGYCFYQVPIEHPVYGSPASSTSTNPETTDATVYGVVRNHSYNLELYSVGNIGSAVNDPDKPIPPIPGDETYYYLGVKMKVLAWRKATQKVNL